MTQLSLFGDAPAQSRRPKPPDWPRGSDRLLFALYPDPETAALIARQGSALRKALGLRGPARPVEVLHVTLRHVGDFVGPPPEVIGQLVDALAGFSFPAFDITLGSRMRFRGGGAFVLLASETANPALIEFRRILCGRLDAAGAGWRKDAAAFKPHVTLSYENHEVDERPIEPITWKAREFVLVHSPQGQTKHLPLTRFPLG